MVPVLDNLLNIASHVTKSLSRVACRLLADRPGSVFTAALFEINRKNSVIT
jgi:hypothetical protein